MTLCSDGTVCSVQNELLMCHLLLLLQEVGSVALRGAGGRVGVVQDLQWSTDVDPME